MKKSTKKKLLKWGLIIAGVALVVVVGALIKASIDGITFAEVFTGVAETAPEVLPEAGEGAETAAACIGL